MLQPALRGKTPGVGFMPKKTPKTEYVLWGTHPSHCGGQWFKISGGSLNACVAEKERRMKEDSRWIKLLALPPGLHPLDELSVSSESALPEYVARDTSDAPTMNGKAIAVLGD